MDAEKIHHLLGELHKELASADALPTDLADEAREVISDLSRSIPEAEGNHGAVERLEEVATKFETEHPGLANAARQIAVALGRMGI